MADFKSVKESRVSITELMLPSHSNFGGKVHGGHILNLMGQIAFACASKHSRRYCVTASVNRVDFLNPIEVGELVTLRASINYTGRTSMVVGVRVDSALYDGYSIPPYYDSLIGKLIVHGRTRPECLMRLRRALDEFVVDGIDTTLPLFRDLIENDDVKSGDYDIHWLEKWLKEQS